MASAAPSSSSSSESKCLLNCCKCYKRLNKRSKSFVCLHNLCEACLPQTECPECGEIFSNGRGEMDQLPSYLLKILRKERLECPEWHCDFCQEDGLTSGAKFWCKDCEMFMCDNCNRLHKKFLQRNHVSVEVEEREKALNLIMADDNKCLLHGKSRDFYCKECNTCFCDTCYKEYHSSESCSSVSGPLSVKEEVMRRQHTEVPAIQREVEEIEKILRGSREIISKSIDRLNNECLRKCEGVWVEFEELMNNERKKAEKICEKIQEEKEMEEEKWLESFKEYERMVKQVGMWQIRVEHLLQELEKKSGVVVLGEGDVLCGLNELMCKCPGTGSQQEGEKNKKWSMPRPVEEFVEYRVTLPNLWLQAMHPSTKEAENESGGCCIIKKTKQPEKLIQQIELIVPPPRSKPDQQLRWMTSFLVSPKDGHFFLSDLENKSILELNKLANFREELFFRDTQNPNFQPMDMCWNSADSFIVCGYGGENNIFFLKRVENPPFLKIIKQIETNENFYSLCKNNGIIFCSNLNFEIYCFTQNGEKIKTIQFDGPVGSPAYVNRLRFDVSTGNFWGSRWDSCEMFCLNSDGKKIDSFKKEEKFHDFSFFNEILFFVANKGIFSFFPQKCFQEFEKIPTRHSPVFSILGNKMFVCFENEEKNLIKIFEII